MASPAEPVPFATGRVGVMSDASRLGGVEVGLAVVAVQQVMLARFGRDMACNTARVVHLIPLPDECDARVVRTLCGGLLRREEIEIIAPVRGMPCTVCLLSYVSITRTVEPSMRSVESGGAELAGGVAYQAWGWPVTDHDGQIRLSLHGDASAIAIPILLSADILRILTARRCAPAVLADPYAPDHHIVLTGERYGVTLPWPPKVYQVTGAVPLPPTMTARGPITWVQPPSKDSLRLSREIDVFSALRTALSDVSPGEDASLDNPSA